MKCLIIAAGKGGRLQQRGDSKPLVPILGIALIERVIRAASVSWFDAVLDRYAGQALQLAALAHDIDRANDVRKIKRVDFNDYDAFKSAHARNGAGQKGDEPYIL